MRFAVVIAPPEENAATNDCLGALCDRLMRAGFNVVRAATSDHLARDLARAIDGLDEEDALLVVVTGALRSGDDQAIALSVSAGEGEEEVGLDAIGAVLRERKAREALLVIDGRGDGAADDAMHAAEQVDAAIHALGAREQGLELLIGVHGGDAAGWPFVRLVTEALDDPHTRDATGAATASRVYARMKEQPELAASVQSFAHVRSANGGRDFVWLSAPEPPPVISRSSLPPPSSMRAPRSRSLAPLPAIEPILAEAERAQSRGAWEEALESYKKALILLGEGNATAKASLYANIGEVKLAQSKPREAETNYEKALVADPKHRRSIEALVKMATVAKEWPRAIANRKRLVAAIDDPAQKADALVALADVVQSEMRDPRGATEALEQALVAQPSSVAILERLRAAYEAANRWTSVRDVIGKMADCAASSADRAELRFQQADVTMARLRDEAPGLAQLEAALEDQPSHEKALSALVAVRTRRQEWNALDRLYATLIDRFASEGDSERAWDACKRLGALRKDRLFDGPGAIDAWQGALRCKPKDVETRAALAELLVAKGDTDGAVTELETAAAHEPLRAATHRRLFELHRRKGNVDRAWLAATALEELGATNVDQDMLIEQFRPEGGVRPAASLHDEAWDSALRAPGADDVVAEMMRAIAPAAVAMRVEELRVAKRLVTLDPAKKQAEMSTASIVRTFGFVSQVLGVSTPDLYVLDDVPGGLAAAQVGWPSTAVGPEVLSGKSVQELSFVVARHLAYYRPEHYVLVFFPTLSDVTALFLAALKLALPEVPVPTHAAAAAAKLRKELERHATPSTKVALAAAVERLSARGGKVDLAAWIRSVELTATRAGLLISGDLAVATGVMNGESRAIAELTLSDKRNDLLAFCASRALADLRVKLGMAAQASLAPSSVAKGISERPPTIQA
jgi:tetratricopeptide (TPR) repeat protein